MNIGVLTSNVLWPKFKGKYQERIIGTATNIWNTRKSYADFYDDTCIPPEFCKAHQENDKAVMEAYGFDCRTMSESEYVAELMKMYKKLVEE